MKTTLAAFLLLASLTGVPAQILYRQDFEDGFQDITLIDNDGHTPAAQVSSFTAAWNVRGDLLGNAAVSNSWYQPAGQSDDWMITPAIGGITANTILEWDARSFEASTPDTYRVLVSVGGTDMADFTDEIFQVNGEAAKGTFTRHFVLLDDYVGQNIHIAFVNVSNNQYLLAVDNIVVREVYTVDVALLNVEVDAYVRTGTANPVRYTLQNNGFQTIDTLVVNWSDGIHNFSETLTGLALGFGETYEGVFTDSFIATGADEYPLQFTIASVGSHLDERTDNNSASAVSAGVTTIVPRRVVAEEGTGTWCGWCPRGAVFMEQMHLTYPDLFIPITVHNGPNEPMKNVEYDNAFSMFLNYPGYPAVLLDRKVLLDPTDLDSVFQVVQQAVAPVSVAVQATVDAPSRKMLIEGNITTYTHRTDAQLRLVLVVAENDVRGTSNGYRQTNFYSGGIIGPMGGFENLPNPVPASQMRYDFVGRQLLYGFQGLPGVVPAVFHENDAFGFTASWDVPDTYDLDQLYVVAMVVDGASDDVLNAARSEAVIITAVQEDIPELASLKIYPNPAQGTARVDMEMTEAAPVSIELLNQLGQTVGTQNHGMLSAGRSVLPVRVNGLPAGVYTVKMRIGGKVVLGRVVVE